VEFLSPPEVENEQKDGQRSQQAGEQAHANTDIPASCRLRTADKSDGRADLYLREMSLSRFRRGLHCITSGLWNPEGRCWREYAIVAMHGSSTRGARQRHGYPGFRVRDENVDNAVVVRLVRGASLDVGIVGFGTFKAQRLLAGNGYSFGLPESLDFCDVLRFHGGLVRRDLEKQESNQQQYKRSQRRDDSKNNWDERW